MRTVFHELEDDHLQIHSDLATEYNRLVPFDPASVAKSLALDARDYGLADGVTADGQAMQNAFDAVSSLRQWGDRSIAGCRLIFPPGVFVPTVQHGNPAAAIKRLTLVSPTGSGGTIVVEGATGGGTVFQAPNAGTGAGRVTVTGTVTRAGNVFTVPCTAHGLASGDPIVFNLTSRANTKNFVSTNAVTIIDADHFTYLMGDTTAANLDLLKVANGAVIDKLGWLIEPLGFRQNELLYFRDIEWRGPPVDVTNLGNARIGDPNNLPSPQCGYAVRKTSRIAMQDCLFDGWWAAEVLHGAARGAAGKQNTDHNSSTRCQYMNNVDHILFHSNQKFSGYLDVGGSRDHSWRDCQWGVSARSYVAVADAGSYKGGTIDIGHDKSVPFPFYVEGVDGVLPNDQPKFSLLTGNWKNESPGNTAIGWDESKLSTWDQSKMTLRSEVSIAINGGPGNPNTSTLCPWAVTTSITAAMQTVNLPAGHGIRVGDHLAVASGVTVGGAYVPGLGDGCSIVKTVSTNTVTMDRPDLDTRTGTDGVTNGTTTFTSASGNWNADTDNGRTLTGTNIPASTTVTVVDSSTLLLSNAATGTGTGGSWTLTTRTVSSYSAIAGLVCGWRFGYIDNLSVAWQAHLQSGGNQMARSLFWWNFNQEPNASHIEYMTADTIGAGAAGADLPSFTIETAQPAGYANRLKVSRGHQTFWLRLHNAAEATAVALGEVLELSTAGTVKRSTGVKAHLFGGIAMQPSGASGAVSVATNGKVGGAAVVVASRPYLMAALTPQSLPSHDSPTTVLVTSAAPAGTTNTCADGDVIVDTKDAAVGTWDGSTAGFRVLGTAIAAKAGGKVALELISPYWTT